MNGMSCSLGGFMARLVMEGKLALSLRNSSAGGAHGLNSRLPTNRMRAIEIREIREAFHGTTHQTAVPRRSRRQPAAPARVDRGVEALSGETDRRCRAETGRA